MTTFIVQFGNQEQGVFWKEIEADNLTAAKIKATMIANRHTEEVTMLAIESIDGELLASKNFAGKKAVWESHAEEAQAVDAVDAVEQQADAQPKKPKLIERWNSEGVREFFVQGMNHEIKMRCDVIPPLHHKIISCADTDSSYTLTSKDAYDMLCLFERNLETPRCMCFIKCLCGTYVYVTMDEAQALGAISKRRVTASIPKELPASKGAARLCYKGVRWNERCEPYLTSDNEEIVELCSTNLCDVLVKEGNFIIGTVPDEYVNRRRFMLSESAGDAIESKLYCRRGDIANVGFIITKCGLAVVVTDLEASLLGEEFTQIEIKR